MKVVDWPTPATAGELREAGVRAHGPLERAEVQRLARDGVRALALPLHGARPEVHDWVARAEGSFAASLMTLEAARSHGLEVAVHTLLTRSNARVIDELPKLLKARGVRLWVVEVASTRDAETSLVPRFGMAIPSALAALERARRLGLEAYLRGAPRCTLGRFGERALPAPPRAYAPVCAGCPAHSTCPGVDAGYLERFGPGELRPAPAAELRAPRLAVLLG